MLTNHEKHQIANAISMLPFAYITWVAGEWPLAVSITVMWVCALVYHVYMAMEKYKTSFRWFTGDIYGQFITIWLTGALSKCLPDWIRQIWTACGGIAFVALLVFTIEASENSDNGCSPEKLMMKRIVCGAHLAIAIVGGLVICNAPAYWISVGLLVAIAITFVIDECEMSYIWAFGHILCAAYTYYTWKAHGLLRN